MWNMELTTGLGTTYSCVANYEGASVEISELTECWDILYAWLIF